jgi:DnaJ-class molecular chaperone
VTKKPKAGGKSMKMKCSSCRGKGYEGEWRIIKKQNLWVVKDCPFCNGKGMIEVWITDKRTVSKKKKLYYPEFI